MGAAVVVLFAFEFLTFFQPSNDSRFLGFKRLSPISPQANPARRAVVKVNIRLRRQVAALPKQSSKILAAYAVAAYILDL